MHAAVQASVIDDDNFKYSITPYEGEPVKFVAGDLGVFPAGMNCR